MASHGDQVPYYLGHIGPIWYFLDVQMKRGGLGVCSESLFPIAGPESLEVYDSKAY